MDPEVVLAPDRNPTPLSLSLEYLLARFVDDAMLFGPCMSESLFAVRVGLARGDEGIARWPGLGGGKLVTRSPLRGGRGKASAIDTARLGVPDLSSDGVPSMPD